MPRKDQRQTTKSARQVGAGAAPSKAAGGRRAPTGAARKVVYPTHDDKLLASGKAAGRASPSPGDGWTPDAAVVREGPDVLPRRAEARRAKAEARVTYPERKADFNPADGIVGEGPEVLQPSRLAYQDDARGIWLYHGDCLEVMDRLLAKHPGGCFDMIFADPPYFLSNGGITCHAGRMVKVDKGDWDKSEGPIKNHEFNTAWLERCQRLLKPNGTIWVSGTHHVIFSIGYVMQQLGMKLLNQVTWQKPNPPPNLACRYFTHSTETVLWAAKNEKSKHVFHYKDMVAANGGKQMKDVWTLTAPKPDEKTLGKHPTQKPVALLERILLASTSPGDLILDPFLGGGTTAVAATHRGRRCVGIEMESAHLELTKRRVLEARAVGEPLSVHIRRDVDMQAGQQDFFAVNQSR